MDEINERNFVSYLDQLPVNNNCLYNHADYHLWSGVDLAIETQYIKVGNINVPFQNLAYNISLDNKQVNLHLWPYYNCNIYCCKRCKALFFHHYKDIDSRYDGFRMIRKEILNEDCLKISTEIYSGNLNKTSFSRICNKLFKN